VPVERWTPERRRQQTRDALIDAASEVFARRGFEGASLEEIAEAAGFTRGAIYKNFGGKEDLFFAVNDRFNEQAVQAFTNYLPDRTTLGGLDFFAIAKRWRHTAATDPQLVALGLEFNLYLLRNPEARKRSAVHRKKTADMVARLIEDYASNNGITLRLPALTIARVVLAAADGLAYAARMDGDDLYAPFLELLNAAMPLPDPS
jgi:AcrR family transcriptional regulator